MPLLLWQFEDIAIGLNPPFRGFDDTYKKKLNPLQQVVCLSHPHKIIVIKAAIALEKIRHLQQRLL